MTWFAHMCHFCGHRHKDVDFIAGDSNYQCKDLEVCQMRRELLTDRQRTFLDILGRLPEAGD